MASPQFERKKARIAGRVARRMKRRGRDLSDPEVQRKIDQRSNKRAAVRTQRENARVADGRPRQDPRAPGGKRGPSAPSPSPAPEPVTPVEDPRRRRMIAADGRVLGAAPGFAGNVTPAREQVPLDNGRPVGAVPEMVAAPAAPMPVPAQPVIEQSGVVSAPVAPPQAAAPAPVPVDADLPAAAAPEPVAAAPAPAPPQQMVAPAAPAQPLQMQPTFAPVRQFPGLQPQLPGGLVGAMGGAVPPSALIPRAPQPAQRFAGTVESPNLMTRFGG